MSKVLISGYYGFGNTGDEAILEVLSSQLKSSGIEVGVFSNNPKETEKNYGVKAYPRFKLNKIIKAISQCDAIISGGGSLFQDATSSTSLYYYLGIVQLGMWMRKKVFVYSQGIGPIYKKVNQKIFSCVIKKAASISLRDSISKNELTRLKIDKKVYVEVTADPVFLLESAPEEKAEQVLSLLGIERKKDSLLIGLSVRQWKDSPTSASTFAQIVDNIIQKYGATVVFLPFHHPSDLEFSKKIVGLMKNEAAVLEDRLLPSEVMAVMGKMDINIGVRLHALILSAAVGVPVIGISYDPKIDGFLNSIGLTSACTYQELNWEAIDDAIAYCMDNREDLSKIIKDKAVENKKLAKDTFNRLLEGLKI